MTQVHNPLTVLRSTMMAHKRAGILLALFLSGCTTMQFAQDQATLQGWLQTAETDLQSAYMGIMQNCAAIQSLEQDAQVLACLASTSKGVQNSVQRAVSATNAICSSVQPTNPTIASVVTTIANAYAAAKNAQLTGACQ